MANAAPKGSPMTAATAVAERLTVRESPTMRTNSAVPRAAQTSANGTVQILSHFLLMAAIGVALNPVAAFAVGLPLAYAFKQVAAEGRSEQVSEARCQRARLRSVTGFTSFGKSRRVTAAVTMIAFVSVSGICGSTAFLCRARSAPNSG
jgi:hypothetical protein